MKTIKWLESKDPCSDGLDWFVTNRSRCNTDIEVIELLIKEDYLDWANWGITRLLNKKQCIQYSVYAAKQVLPIFEAKYPEDKRPRKAIEAAEAVLKSNTKRNRGAADAAANAAYAAADAASGDYIADAAANAAYAAAYAATNTAYAAANAAYAARANAANAAAMYKKILKYGIELLRINQRGD